MKRLREHGLTPDNISRTPAGELEEILKPVGFYKASQYYCFLTEKLGKEYVSMGFSGLKMTLSILLKGLPTVCNQCFLKEINTRKLRSGWELKANPYISLTGPCSPSMTPLTVSSLVFIHHPRKPSSVALCCVCFRKKTPENSNKVNKDKQKHSRYSTKPTLNYAKHLKVTREQLSHYLIHRSFGHALLIVSSLN